MLFGKRLFPYPVLNADKSLNPTQLAQKYVKEVAERAAKAKAEEEELGI